MEINDAEAGASEELEFNGRENDALLGDADARWQSFDAPASGLDDPQALRPGEEAGEADGSPWLDASASEYPEGEVFLDDCSAGSWLRNGRFGGDRENSPRRGWFGLAHYGGSALPSARRGGWCAAAYGAGAAAWEAQLLPEGLIYHPYLADVKAARLGSSWLWTQDFGWVWDIALGGRVGVFRFGDRGQHGRIEGWQLDVEGVAFPRLDLETQRDLLAVDFRAGTFLTYGRGRWQSQFGYYHLSSHAGDELLLRNPAFVRINYVRDEILLGLSYFPLDALRLYTDLGYAVYTSGGAEPFELQFGAEFSPSRITGLRPAPFLAVHGNLREELNYGGYLAVQTGLQWRSAAARRLRLGLEYFNGKSRQYEFFNTFEQQVGGGLWYDF